MLVHLSLHLVDEQVRVDRVRYSEKRGYHEEETAMNRTHLLTHLAWRGALALGLLICLLAFTGRQGFAASAASPSFVRIVDASPDAAVVDVFVDGKKFLGNIQYASVTDYLQLPAGSHKVQAALLGKGLGGRAIVQTISVQAGLAYTVAAIGTKSAGYSLKIFVDDNLMAAGQAKVRFYNLSPLATSLSIYSGSNTLVASLPYEQGSTYLRLRTNLYTFTLNASRPRLTLQDRVSLKTNTITSIFILPVFRSLSQLQFVHVQIKGLPNVAGTGSDPNAEPINSSPFMPLAPGALGALALGAMSTGVLARLRPFRRKVSNPVPELALCLFVALVALAFSVGGLSLAAGASGRAALPLERLIIPSIGINTPIESVGVRSDGTMETPRQSPWNDVGWYDNGPRPGERGSAVIAGHLDRPGGDPAVFWRLRDLHVGDAVLVVGAQGKMLRFHVTRIVFYRPSAAPAQGIFGNASGHFLNLMTCAGDWIPTAHQTALRLVVYTTMG